MQRIAALSALFLCLSGLPGCHNGGDSTTVVNQAQPQRAASLVTGQVIDLSTNKPIEGATATLIVDGTSTETAQTAQSSNPDLDGHFQFQSIPAGTQTLEISAPGYAPVKHSIEVPGEEKISVSYSSTSTTGSSLQLDLGKIGLSKPLSVTFHVADENAKPVAGAAVTLLPNGFSDQCYSSVNTDFQGQQEAIHTDSTGTATFTDLSPCALYLIEVPPLDINNDGIPDYALFTTSNFSYGTGVVGSGNHLANYSHPLNIVLTKQQALPNLSVVYNSLKSWPSGHQNLILLNADQVSRQLTSYHYLHADDSFFVAFNTQSSPLTPASVDQLNDFVATANPGYDRAQPTGATVKLSSDGLFLTTTAPSSGYQDNQILQLSGSYQAAGGGGNGSTVDLSGNNLFYVDPTSAPKIIGASIFNDHVDSTYTFSTGVSVNFSKFVYGTIKEIAYNGTRPSYNYFPSTYLALGTTMGCSTCSGVVFAEYFSVNSTPSPGDTISVDVDVKDLDGNVLQGTFDLTVH